MTEQTRRRDVWGMLLRAFAWGMVWVTFAFLLNNYLNFWRGWPGADTVFGTGATGLSWIQAGFYVVALGMAVALALRNDGRPLRSDSVAISNIAAYIARACFFAVTIVGIVDFTISFLRVEAMLPGLFGDRTATDLGLSRFRGPYIHVPLVALGFVIAFFTRTLGFTWLTLLVVVAELQIVLGRFVFGYEQAFMADLVRMWYAALFLFASAYTLVEEGHVRIDVFYAARSDQTKAIVNGLGSVFLGMVLCWVILIFGMASGSSAINATVLSFEQGQQGFGMFTKYFMAAFLAVFAVTMLVQFSSYLLQAAADYRGEPGKRESASADGM